MSSGMETLKWIRKKLAGWNRQQYLVVLLLGALLLIVAIPTENEQQTQEETSLFGAAEDDAAEQIAASAEAYCTKVEGQLEELIGAMEGVEQVVAMVTLEDLGESVLDADSSLEVSRVQPNIRGVCVVVCGPSAAARQMEIYQMVQALFSLDAHKIAIIISEL